MKTPWNLISRNAALFMAAIAFVLAQSAGAQTAKIEQDSAAAGNSAAAGAKDPHQARAENKPLRDATQPAGILPESQPGFGSSPEAGNFRSICSTVLIEKTEEDLEFTAMETRLLCGDTAADQVGTPWANIPPNQAAFFMKGFLQTRGYHEPAFIQDQRTLFVRPGYMSRLVDFRISGGPETWHPPKRRLIVGEPLTPTLLDDLQGWTLSQIKNEGYACATAESRADPRSGLVRVHLEPGEAKLVKGVESTGDPGLDERALNRYNAFLVDSLYRESLITLTRNRTLEDGILQNIVLSARCEDDGVRIMRDVVLGPSRTLRFGVGASTDEGLRVRAVARQNRIGSMASTAQLRANVSYREPDVNSQIVDASFRWYYSKMAARQFIEPVALFEHIAEASYETQQTQAKVNYGWTNEFQTGQVEARIGPNWLESFRTRGPGVGRDTVIFMEGDFRWMHHDFEYFTQSPRTGEFISVNALVAQQSWGSSFTAQRLQLQGQKLWNIFRYDPPLFILGTRFGITSLFSPDDLRPEDLPVRFLTFLGGEQDLRGFTRHTLPRSGTGALSSATASIEGRLHRVILKRADVFSFIDAGLLGGKGLRLEEPIFLSPGVGVRWESPFGTLRTYVAQRFAILEKANEEPYNKQWRIGFTFGEEF